MSYFEAINLRTEIDVIERVQVRTKDDMVHMVDMDKTIEIEPAAYGYEGLENGNVIELKGRLEQKAKQAEKEARKNDLEPIFRSITAKEMKEKGLEALKPNAKPSHKKVKRGSDEWIEQRQQFRRHVG